MRHLYLVLPVGGFVLVAVLAGLASPPWQPIATTLFQAYIFIVLTWALWRLSRLLWLNRVLIRSRLRGRPRKAWDAYVRALFDGYAATYDKHLLDGLDYGGPDHLGRLLAEHASPDGTSDIADLGCGTGLCGPVLRPFARSLTGVDLSTAMLDRARKTGCYDHLENANVLSFLLERPRSFDGLTAIDVAPYFKELDHLFGACRTALRQDGWLIATTETDPPAQPSRFSHSSRTVHASAERTGLKVMVEQTATLRQEANQPVIAGLYLLQRS